MIHSNDVMRADSGTADIRPRSLLPKSVTISRYLRILLGKKTDDMEAADDPALPPFYAEYSKRLGLRLDGTENRRLLMAVDEWLGTPYLWGGCSEFGIDCSCLVKFIYKDVYDITLNRTCLTIFQKDVTTVEADELQEGDILGFETDDNGVSHVGIYLKDNKFVHASLSKGVMISSLDQSYFKKRFVAGGRVLSHRQVRLAKLFIGDLMVVTQ